MSELRADRITISKANRPIVKHASLYLGSGELIVLLGPNGAGKTTLLRSILGMEKHSGKVTLNGDALDRLSPIERAKAIAYLPQTRPLAWPNRVRDIVALGRFAHGATVGRLSTEDADAVSRAITKCKLTDLVDRQADTLSGGELGRVHCARAFASNTPFLIADEPVAALDPLHQFRVLDLFKDYTVAGNGALIVLHDIQLAARFADRLIWMKQGEIIAQGSVEETLTPDMISGIYGVSAEIDGRQINILGPRP